MYHQAVTLLIQVFNGCQQSGLEGLIKKPGIQYQLVILFQKDFCQGVRIGSAEQLTGYFIDGKQSDPFIMLGLVGGNFRVQGFWYPVQCDAVVGFHHKFFLQPQLLLKVLELCQKINQFPGNFPQNLQPGKIGLHHRGIGIADIIQPHDLVFDVKVQLPAQKAAQILVDEIIHGVPGCVLVDISGQQGTVPVAFGWRRKGENLVIYGAKGMSIRG